MHLLVKLIAKPFRTCNGCKVKAKSRIRNVEGGDVLSNLIAVLAVVNGNNCTSLSAQCVLIETKRTLSLLHNSGCEMNYFPLFPAADHWTLSGY